MKFKYIYFDVANTLLYKPDLYKIIQKTLNESGINIDLVTIKNRHIIISEFIPSPSTTSKDFYEVFNREFLISLGVIPQKDLINKIYNNLKNLSWEKYADVDSINSIQIPKGIISNWDSTLTKKLDSIVKSEFTYVFASEEQGIKKPDIEIFQKAVAMSGCKSYEILFVGNSIKLDIIPAAQTGMKAVLIDRDNFYPNFTGLKIDSLYKITKIIT